MQWTNLVHNLCLSIRFYNCIHMRRGGLHTAPHFGTVRCHIRLLLLHKCRLCIHPHTYNGILKISAYQLKNSFKIVYKVLSRAFYFTLSINMKNKTYATYRTHSLESCKIKIATIQATLCLTILESLLKGCY